MEEFNKIVGKYTIDLTSKFKSDYKKIKKQHKDLTKLAYVIYELANDEELESKYNNHKLIDDKEYNDCFECQDWLLVYKIKENELFMLLQLVHIVYENIQNYLIIINYIK